MKIPVLIEPLVNDGFRATGSSPFCFSVEAASRDEALAALRTRIERQLASGASLVPLEIQTPEEANPWLAGAGMFRDDPLHQAWIEAMAEYRREADGDIDGP